MRTSFIKGWVEAAKGGRLDDLPPGARTIESYGESLFVEIPVGAVGSLEARGLIFQPLGDADLLSVGGERFDVRGGEPPIADEWRAGAPTLGGRRPYLVKFDAPVKPEWIAGIESAGAELVQYVAHFGYLVFGPPDIATRMRALRDVAYSGEYHAAYKTTPQLREKAAGNETIPLWVVYFDLPGYEQKIEAMLLRGARLVHRVDAASTSQWALLHHVVYENVRARDLPSILREPEVYRAEQWFPPQLADERAAQITAGNISAAQPVLGYYAWLAELGADGTGVTVAVADTGLDTGDPNTIHEDLRGRTSFSSAFGCTTNRDLDGHGTTTASIALGDPRPPTGTDLTDPGGFFWGAGAAPAADLFFQKMLGMDCPILTYAYAATLAQDAVKNGGAEIGTHSFGDGQIPPNGYSATAAEWDARVRDADTTTAGSQPYAVVFAAGNGGPRSGTLGSPNAAKNIISVGATENYRPAQCPGVSGCYGPADEIDTLASYSSRGPTYDLRIKPDIAAPGHVIVGAKSSVASYDCYCDDPSGFWCCASQGVDGMDKYAVEMGTSQAAPRVGGASAIVFDWFKDRFAVFPSPAMNKAILINGAVDMNVRDVPNNNEGWGRVNLKNSLQNPLPSQYVDQTTVIGTTGDAGALTTNYIVQDRSKPVKATLVWTDPAGHSGCNPCLVNDLDLILTQGATTWRGNNFTNGVTNTGSVTDMLNNIEGINLAGDSLTCSSFQVKVRARTLGGDGVPGNTDTTDQDFALVANNAGTSAGPPRAAVQNASLSGGCDADTFLDRRETATLTLQIKNVGCTGAAGVQATLSVDSQPTGASVTVSPTGVVSIGDMAAGVTTPHAWQVTLADNVSSFCGSKVRFRVDLTDAAARSWTEFAEVVLDTAPLVPTTNTDPATVDNSFSKDPTEWSLRSCRTTSSPTSWHMGQADCTGIVRDSSARDLDFVYTIGPDDVIKELSFQHAFNGHFDASFNDLVKVDFDPENDGTFVTLQSWHAGIDAPSSGMTPAGPYDLTPYNATRANTIKVRFRFIGGANWDTGPNRAEGWDVDDIVFKHEAFACDAGSCPACSAPSGLPNNDAYDADACFTSGVVVSWAQDPNTWNDGGGTRTYTVLRDGLPISSGGCGGPISYGTLSCTDMTVALGVAHTYQVRYHNGCALSATTAGITTSDLNCAPPPVNDGTMDGNPVQVSLSGGNITMTWDPSAGATRYNVYMGTLGIFYSHAIFSATGLDGADSCFEPSTSVTFAAPDGSVYFLIASDNGIVESDLGLRTPIATRPYASPACSAH